MHEPNLHLERAQGDSPRVCRAISEYRAGYPDPISISAGQELAVGEKQSEWPGWLWCIDRDGKSGWVPEVYVERQDAVAVALCDYDAVELSVHAGEELILGTEESGWFWCTNRTGQSGWVPVEHLDLPDEA
jgi:uncharacterized protein YgiM (DUF1202 family)